MSAATSSATDCRASPAAARHALTVAAAGTIGYMPFPPALAGKYQSFTEADLTRLRAAGYGEPMLALDDGVTRYVERLISGAASSA